MTPCRWKFWSKPSGTFLPVMSFPLYLQSVRMSLAKQLVDCPWVCQVYHLNCFYLRRIPEGTGWILDGFPCTQAQAKLMEKALSGFDTNTNKTQKSKSKRSQLAPDPKPVPVPPKPSSGINVVILFDITNELCLKRSAGRSCESLNWKFLSTMMVLLMHCSIIL